MATEREKGKKHKWKKLTFEEKFAKKSRQHIRQEIAIIKEEIRNAYSVQVRQEQGYEPTEAERRMISERDIAISVVERLSNRLSKLGVKETPETSYRPDTTHTFQLIHFFYLVKLSQQGHGYMLSSLYPDFESSTLSYLSDILMDYSIKAAQDKNIKTRREYREKVNEILNKMTRGENEPIATGFTTTYAHIRFLLDSLNDIQNPLESGTAPFVPPLFVNIPTVKSAHSFTLGQPTVPFPASLLAAYQNNPSIYVNDENINDKDSEDSLGDKLDDKTQEKKSRKRKDPMENKNNNKAKNEEETKEAEDIKEEIDDKKNRSDNKKVDIKGFDDNNSEEKETRQQGDLIGTMTESTQMNKDSQFEDVDEDQVVELQPSPLDSLWEDIPNSNSDTNEPSLKSDLGYSRWESFELPKRTRMNYPPVKHFKRSPNR